MDIIGLVKKYNAFQQKVGDAINSGFETEIPSLFIENFRKEVNGVVLVSERSYLKEQLEGVRKISGPWKIELKDQLPCVDGKRCVIRYHLMSTNLGIFDVMAILKAHESGLLENVSEVYYQFNA